MTYTAKTNWQGNDPVTEYDLNRWESGIKNAHDGQMFKLTAEDGTPKQIGITNADLITESGEYYTAANCIGMPDNEFYKITTQKINAGASVQYAVKIVSNQLFSRIRSSSIWQPWRKLTDTNLLGSVLLGNKLVDQSLANFLGKLGGSTTANPHIYKTGTSTTLFTPNGGSEEINATKLNALMVLDGITASVTTSVNGGISQGLFSLNVLEHVLRTYGTFPGATLADKIAWVKANISKLTFNWFGFGAGPLGNKATVANWNGSTWVTTASVMTSTPSKITGILTSANMSRIDDNGFIHFLTYAEASDGTTASVINTDYVELLVELKTDILSSLPVATTTTPGVMSPADKALFDGAQKVKLTADNGWVKQIVSDLNTITSPGTFYAITTTLNKPPGAGDFLVVEQYYADGTETAIQRATDIVKSETYLRTRTSSGWKPWRKLTDTNLLGNVLLGNKFVDQTIANYVGKVSGSTAANPHIAKSHVLNSLMVTSAGSEFVSAYASVSALDGTNAAVNTSTNGNIPQLLFSFNVLEQELRTYGTIPGTTLAEKVAWAKVNISKITLPWFGFGSGPAGNKAIIAAYLDSVWVTRVTSTANVVTKSTVTLTGAAVASAIDANGFVHFLVYADASDGTTPSVINTDYVELQIELSTDIKTNLLNTDEITALKKVKSNKDVNGIFTTITYRRKSDDTLYATSVLSGGTSPSYTTRTITYYATNGTTVSKIATFALSYDADGSLISEV